MDEYIKKSDALKASKLVYIECLYLDEEEYEEAEADDIRVVFARDIESIPAADVEEVRHGEWLEDNKWQPCSECHKRGKKSWKYCPNCGAKMDGKKGEKNDSRN